MDQHRPAVMAVLARNQYQQPGRTKLEEARTRCHHQTDEDDHYDTASTAAWGRRRRDLAPENVGLFQHDDETSRCSSSGANNDGIIQGGGPCSSGTGEKHEIRRRTHADHHRKRSTNWRGRHGLDGAAKVRADIVGRRTRLHLQMTARAPAGGCAGAAECRGH